MKAATTNTASSVNTSTIDKSAINTSLEDIPFQAASVDIWEKKYRLQSKDGVVVDETSGAKISYGHYVMALYPPDALPRTPVPRPTSLPPLPLIARYPAL